MKLLLFLRLEKLPDHRIGTFELSPRVHMDSNQLLFNERIEKLPLGNS